MFKAEFVTLISLKVPSGTLGNAKPIAKRRKWNQKLASKNASFSPLPPLPHLLAAVLHPKKKTNLAFGGKWGEEFGEARQQARGCFAVADDLFRLWLIRGLLDLSSNKVVGYSRLRRPFFFHFKTRCQFAY